MFRRLSRWAIAGGMMVMGVGLVQAQGNSIPNTAMLGGQLTVFDDSEEAFTNEIPGLTETQLAHFEEGDDGFERRFDQDELGPFFDAASCDGCHVEDGRGRAPDTLAVSDNNESDRQRDRNRNGNDRQRGDNDRRPPPNGNRNNNPPPPRGQRNNVSLQGTNVTGFIVQLSIPDRDLYGNLPDPAYGGQFQAQSVFGVEEEGNFIIGYEDVVVEFDDGTTVTLRQPVYSFTNLAYGPMSEDVMISARVAPQMIGLGLLEAISEETILAMADPNDSNGDGISGRPNYVWDFYNNRTALGRFGWKANNPHLVQQAAGAFFNDMGLTTSIFSDPTCTSAHPICALMPDGDVPEVSDEELLAVAFYTQTLAVPAQRDFDNPQVQAGAVIFEEAGCTSCHVATIETGVHPTVAQLSYQKIHPYTDLLLHDMGTGLADGRPHGEASGSEWRTAPLWGIGLFETVNDHTFYLHDGRARNLMEAILWHGGEAESSTDYVLGLNVDERAALLAFLRSL